MNKAVIFTLSGLLVIGSGEATLAEAHNKVQQALNWEMPTLECEKPVLRGAGMAIVDASGTRKQVDTDSYKLGRHERKMNRWNTCVKKYKEVLNVDFETLKSSAQYGLSKNQANTIMGKMALIQSALVSPEGIAAK